MPDASGNFGFLSHYDAQLVRLGALAERYFTEDPNTCLIKLRQFAELLAQQLAARMGMFTSPNEPFADLLKRLKAERAMPREAGDLFHQLRVAGNDAAHAHRNDHATALTQLKIARQLALWFHTTFSGDTNFKGGPFVPPTSPADASADLRIEIERLNVELQASQSAAERARSEAEQHARDKESAQQVAQREAAERTIWETLAQEAETGKLALAAELNQLQQAASVKPLKAIAALQEQAEVASREINLDEAATRAIIDQQLARRGWLADTRNITYAKGGRPAKGQNMAISEWPTETGPADYALFAGMMLVGVVEAKRKRKNVSASLTQAERYSQGIKLGSEGQFAGGPWDKFKVPFLFATNGRPYLKQIETESGIWFRDARSPTNHARPLTDWFTAEGLKAGRLTGKKPMLRSSQSHTISALSCVLIKRQPSRKLKKSLPKAGAKCWPRWQQAPARQSLPSPFFTGSFLRDDSGACVSSWIAAPSAIRRETSSRRRRSWACALLLKFSA
jgi:type I restriction enzyme R subunit